MRLSHQLKVYFFKLSFPIASFYYAPCNGENIVQGGSQLRIRAKFPFTALYSAVEDGVVCRPVSVGSLIAPIQRLLFQALHSHSFLLICTLYWCKHCTGRDAVPNLSKISIHGPVRRGWGLSSLQARPGRCAFRIDQSFTFLSSPSR